MWSTGQIPGPEDDVIIDATGFYSIILQNDTEVVINSLDYSPADCDCLANGKMKCYTLFIVASPLRVISSIALNGESAHLALINASLTSDRMSIIDGDLIGHGTINVPLTEFLGGSMRPDILSLTNDHYNITFVTGAIGTLTFNGNVTTDATRLYFDIINLALLQMDTVVIKGSFYPLALFFNIYSQSSTFENVTFDLAQYLFDIEEVIPPIEDAPIFSLYLFSNMDSSTALFLGCTLGFPIQNYPCGTFSVLLGGVCCKNGWEGERCDDPVCPPCNGHGVCAYGAPNQEPPSCDCNDGWMGNSCEFPDCDSDCSRHGVCQEVNNSVKCVCDQGWKGKECDKAVCPGTVPCSGRGTCDTTNNLPVCDCFVGYEGNACELEVIGTLCAQNCSNHGECVNGTCYCNSVWKGTACNIPICPGEISNCNSNGYCVTFNNDTESRCDCAAGWEGGDCSIVYCPEECNGRGTCISEGLEVPSCDCSYPYMGDSCALMEEKESSDGNSFNGGPIAGIVVAVAVAVMIAGIVGVVIYKKREKKALDKELSGLALKAQQRSANSV